MSPAIEFGYKAIKPITAEHPIGSGEIVTYNPGEEVPAGDWGRAADSLVENGKIMRYARNVYEAGEVGGQAAPAVEDAGAASPSPEDNPDWPGQTGETVTYPLNQGRGNYLLSDGTRVRGKDKAQAAQAELDKAA
jgi:hypothetical protein